LWEILSNQELTIPSTLAYDACRRPGLKALPYGSAPRHRRHANQMHNPTYNTAHPFNPLRLLKAWDPTSAEIAPAAKRWVKGPGGQAALLRFFDAYAEAERVYIQSQLQNRGDLYRQSRAMRKAARNSFERTVKWVARELAPPSDATGARKPATIEERVFRRARAGLRSVIHFEYFVRQRPGIPIAYR